MGAAAGGAKTPAENNDNKNYTLPLSSIFPKNFKFRNCL